MTEATPARDGGEPLPCPFCQAKMRWNAGEEDGPYWDHPGGRLGESPRVECWLDSACITPGKGEGSVQDWNRRAPTPQGGDLRAALEDVLNTSGARGSFHAIKHLEAVRRAETALSACPADASTLAGQGEPASSPAVGTAGADTERQVEVNIARAIARHLALKVGRVLDADDYDALARVVLAEADKRRPIDGAAVEAAILTVSEGGEVIGREADAMVGYELGWRDGNNSAAPTAASAGESALRELVRHADTLLAYARWTVGDESCGHHPTMPSPIAQLSAALKPFLAEYGYAASKARSAISAGGRKEEG